MHTCMHTCACVCMHTYMCPHACAPITVQHAAPQDPGPGPGTALASAPACHRVTSLGDPGPQGTPQPIPCAPPCTPLPPSSLDLAALPELLGAMQIG